MDYITAIVRQKFVLGIERTSVLYIYANGSKLLIILLHPVARTALMTPPSALQHAYTSKFVYIYGEIKKAPINEGGPAGWSVPPGECYEKIKLLF